MDYWWSTLPLSCFQDILFFSVNDRGVFYGKVTIDILGCFSRRWKWRSRIVKKTTVDLLAFLPKASVKQRLKHRDGFVSSCHWCYRWCRKEAFENVFNHFWRLSFAFTCVCSFKTEMTSWKIGVSSWLRWIFVSDTVIQIWCLNL